MKILQLLGFEQKRLIFHHRHRGLIGRRASLSNNSQLTLVAKLPGPAGLAEAGVVDPLHRLDEMRAIDGVDTFGVATWGA